MICNKVKYYDKISAMFILSQCKKANRFGNHNRRELRLYFCKKCNAYHLTSKKINI